MLHVSASHIFFLPFSLMTHQVCSPPPGVAQPPQACLIKKKKEIGDSNTFSWKRQWQTGVTIWFPNRRTVPRWLYFSEVGRRLLTRFFFLPHVAQFWREAEVFFGGRGPIIHELAGRACDDSLLSYSQCGERRQWRDIFYIRTTKELEVISTTYSIYCSTLP